MANELGDAPIQPEYIRQMNTIAGVLTYTLAQIDDNEALNAAIGKIDDFWSAMRAALIMASKP
jgi:hypothetical protein